MCGEGNKPSAQQIELKLVQSIDIIRSPDIMFTATVVKVWVSCGGWLLELAGIWKNYIIVRE